MSRSGGSRAYNVLIGVLAVAIVGVVSFAAYRVSQLKPSPNPVASAPAAGLAPAATTAAGSPAAIEPWTKVSASVACQGANRRLVLTTGRNGGPSAAPAARQTPAGGKADGWNFIPATGVTVVGVIVTWRDARGTLAPAQGYRPMGAPSPTLPSAPAPGSEPARVEWCSSQ